ncbi:MAG TPA: BadF/BadG/BcrA/BcrD ATPase family protein [Candidatus Kapabacteria bacterium]|nr:BadF/BadG/BcrA/BcrD ATPase family protein [Candidatus Kapabacteria bacterium]
MNDNKPESAGTLAIGVDGGGSRTVVAMHENGKAVEYFEFPESLKYTDIGVVASAARLAEIIGSVTVNLSWSVLKIAIALSGASDETLNKEFESVLSNCFLGKTIICHIESDSTYTLRAAYRNHESGYLIIAGTGSVALSRDIQGNIQKVGGWGRILGDEGSGYWLGLQTLKYYLKATDGAERTGKFFDAIGIELQKYAGDFPALRAKLYSNELNPSAFAPILLSHFEDPTAQKIIDDGAAFLCEQIVLLKKRSVAPVSNRITLHGSVATHPVYVKTISRRLGQEFELLLLSSKDVVDFVLLDAEKL